MSTLSSPGGVAVPPTRVRNGVDLGELVKSWFRNTEFVIFLIVVLLFIIGGAINPRFLNIENLKILTRDSAMLAIAAIGVSFTILVAGIDLSVGSIVGLGGVVVAYFIIVWGLPLWVAIPLTLLLALVIGMGHGLFVTKLKMHGFLITLVTFGLARGGILALTNGFPITGLPLEFNAIGQGYIGNLIPIPVLICGAVTVSAYYLLRFTYIGRQIYAAGGNMEAARLSGVNVDARIILCYVLSVVCAAIVGIITAARLSLGHPAAGEGFELQAIAACILGGISFKGGEGSVLGVLVGALLIGTLQNEMIMLNINPYWHKIVISLVLLAAITFDYVRRRRRV